MVACPIALGTWPRPECSRRTRSRSASAISVSPGTRSTLSLVEQPAESDGVAGARLAIEDNTPPGKFLNQRFTLEECRLEEGEDAVQAATDLAAHSGFIIADLPADALLKVADALRDRGTLLFNARCDRRAAA